MVLLLISNRLNNDYENQALNHQAPNSYTDILDKNYVRVCLETVNSTCVMSKLWYFIDVKLKPNQINQNSL